MRRGRRPSTTRESVATVALELFSANGFEQTTVDEIAAAAGIGRRTFFRYFASKADILWYDHQLRLERMSGYLQACPRGQPLFDAIRAAVVASTDFGAEDHARLGLRIELMETVPALQSHLMLGHASWRRVIAEFVAHRLGMQAGDLLPQSVAYASLGATMATTRWWVRNPGTDLQHNLDQALRRLGTGFDQLDGERAGTDEARADGC
jgi:mycofactocin system transcriptional regulator